jgi:hypothetical protein
MIMEFVPFEIAKKLKEKGFDWETSNIYERNTIACRYEDYPKPIISQVLKWLREEKKIHISTKPYYCEDGLMWAYEIRRIEDDVIIVEVTKAGFLKEEQAALAGMEHAIDKFI